MGLSLIAFDTNHIKQYVFGTDKLKEIRGASSLLDSLNRIVMPQRARAYQAEKVYANGGSGLFVVPTEQAEDFGRAVQKAYLEKTGGGASVTFVWLPLPDHIKDIWHEEIPEFFELLQWHLQEAKQHPPETLALVSHPFMRLCDACGIEYADAGPNSHRVARASDEGDERYCASCQLKRLQDSRVKIQVERTIQQEAVSDAHSSDEYMWAKIIPRLRAMGYELRHENGREVERPDDFNVFRNFKGFKDYIALIYADANSMGKAIGDKKTLAERQTFANFIDETIYTAVCTAIVRHLKVKEHIKPQALLSGDLKHPAFPFDILLMGGDDICMVVPASVAMDVALTLGKTFRDETNQQHTLSVGVILAPIKYPFGLLQKMADTALKSAKQAGSDARAEASNKATIDDTRINFMVVTGGGSNDFKTVYNAVYSKTHKDKRQVFKATLRPYTPDDLQRMLETIRGREGGYLGRSKLHQLREAVLKMNLTTSVSDGLAVLKNWRTRQRNYVVRQVYEFGGRRQLQSSDPNDPVSGFPRVSFPWFADKKQPRTGYDVYRTSLLDFIELYDFVSRDGDDTPDEDSAGEGGDGDGED